VERTYEVVLGRALDKSAFRKRMLDADFLEEVGAADGVLGRVMTFPRMFKSGE
jgi:8-oxo-dGTP diphosphatase